MLEFRRAWMQHIAKFEKSIQILLDLNEFRQNPKYVRAFPGQGFGLTTDRYLRSHGRKLRRNSEW